MNPYENRNQVAKRRDAWYTKNGLHTPKQVLEIQQKNAREEIEKKRTHCSHCDSINFIEVKIFKSCIEERICFDCNMRDFKNPKHRGSIFLDYPKTFYNSFILKFGVKAELMK